MKQATIFLVAISAFFAAPHIYRHFTEDKEVYCSKQRRVIPDSEFLQSALKNREAQIAHFGGMDAYEKYFLSLNRHPNEAGRDFDVKDPNCCQVFRGSSKVKENCTTDDYPVCVSLNFPKLKGPPTYESWRGRTYLFNECGELKKEY